MCRYQPWEVDSSQVEDSTHAGNGMERVDARWETQMAMLEARIANVEARVERLEARMFMLFVKITCADHMAKVEARQNNALTVQDLKILNPSDFPESYSRTDKTKLRGKVVPYDTH
ncbi:hypothetical protein GH714_025002 [Hevea brasiliensis]|uniref:Uncharacterized protein n=1 Tax=Hevea brasiliensis TaxID=3981 RepID=A0A6A6L7Z7_HEVBR|nr:hypothetical protein GH714_025002 [Hevea brasiliensis]